MAPTKHLTHSWLTYWNGYVPPAMRFACVGQGMIEISNPSDGATERRFGGDTLNTAVYLARMGALFPSSRHTG